MPRQTHLLALATAALLAACQPATPAAPAEPPQAETPPPAATPAPAEPAKPADGSAVVALMAHVYRANISGQTDPTCGLKLDADDIDFGPGVNRPANVEAACATTFPELQAVARWQPLGNAGVTLLDKAGKPLGDFSPVQDATGVYIRGGVGGKVFDLRTPEQ